MIQAFILAFEQLGDRRIQRPLLWTILLAMAASALLIAGVSAAFALLEFSGITFIDWALALLGGIAAAVVAWSRRATIPACRRPTRRRSGNIRRPASVSPCSWRSSTC